MATFRRRLQTRPHPQLWLRFGLDKVSAEHADHSRFWPGSVGRFVQLAELEEERECKWQIFPPRRRQPADRIAQTPIVLVAHSMGGLVVKKVSPEAPPMATSRLTLAGLPSRETRPHLRGYCQQNPQPVLSRHPAQRRRLERFCQHIDFHVHRCWVEGICQGAGSGVWNSSGKPSQL